MFINPIPEKDETRDAFIERCIPIVRKYYPNWSESKVQATCSSIWRRSNGNAKFEDELFVNVPEAKEDEFLCNAKLYINTEEDGTESYEIIAAIGNRFMNGGFLPISTLKKSTKQWNSTLHDINHQGIGMWSQDILYFIGYHTDAVYKNKTNELRMKLHPKKNTYFYEAWKAFIELCKEAELTPNVSITYRGSVKYIKAKELPVPYKDYGLHEDDLVPYLEEIFPAAVATVVIGRCSDKDGCGMSNDVSCSRGCPQKEEPKDGFENQVEIIRKRIQIKEKMVKKQ